MFKQTINVAIGVDADMYVHTSNIINLKHLHTDPVNKQVQFISKIKEEKQRILEGFDEILIPTKVEKKLITTEEAYNIYTRESVKYRRSLDIAPNILNLVINYKNPDIENSIKFIKYLDVYLGIPSILLDHNKDRRSFYGMAGIFRLTRTGFIYKSISTYFLSSYDKINWLWNQITKAIIALNNRFKIPQEKEVRDVIYTSNISTAKDLCCIYSIADLNNEIFINS